MASRCRRSAGAGSGRRIITQPSFGTMDTTATAAGMDIAAVIERVGSWEWGTGNWEFRLHTPHSRLPLQADAEAENLRVVGVSFRNWESKVQRDRGWSHRRD